MKYPKSYQSVANTDTNTLRLYRLREDLYQSRHDT